MISREPYAHRRGDAGRYRRLESASDRRDPRQLSVGLRVTSPPDDADLLTRHFRCQMATPSIEIAPSLSMPDGPLRGIAAVTADARSGTPPSGVLRLSLPMRDGPLGELLRAVSAWRT